MSERTKFIAVLAYYFVAWLGMCAWVAYGGPPQSDSAVVRCVCYFFVDGFAFCLCGCGAIGTILCITDSDKVPPPAALFIAFPLCLCGSLAHAQQLDRTVARVELGNALFNDTRLSIDNSTSCATCHDLKGHGSSDGLIVALGLRRGANVGTPGPRHSPAIWNTAFMSGPAFWDGRTATFLQQATQPLTNPIEMGNQTIDQVTNRLNRIPGYRAMFAAAFGSPDINEQRMGTAIEAFEKTLTSLNAPIDFHQAGHKNVLTPGAERGLKLCLEANCFSCHSGDMFTDEKFHNIGISFRSGRTKDGDFDNGRADIVGPGPDRRNVRAFKTPSLREVQSRAPYMHDGRYATLAVVVEHFINGAEFRRDGKARVDKLLDPRVKRLPWKQQDQDDVVEFLATAFAGEVSKPAPPRLP